MKGISSKLNRQMREALLECSLFTNDQELRSIFVDERLKPWQKMLPEASTSVTRVQGIINFLHNKYNKNGQSILVLFFYVLCELTDPNDNCHLKFKNILDAAMQELGPQTCSDQDVSTEDERPFEHVIYNMLVEGYNLEELKTFCFSLNINYDDIQGNDTISSKARELVLLFKRRKQLKLLYQAMKKELPNS